MKIELDGAFEKMVRDKVASGLYRDEEEVVRDALRRLDERERIDERKLEELRTAIQVGLDDYDAGRYVTLRTPEEIDAFMASL